MLIAAALALVNCAAESEWSGDHAQRAGAAEPRDPDLFDIEDLPDTQDDREDGVACGPVRRALVARRPTEVREGLRRTLTELRAELPHRHVSRRQLVGFMRPQPGHGRATDPLSAQDQDLWLGHLLCDQVTREVMTRHYLAKHPELLAGRRGQ